LDGWFCPNCRSLNRDGVQRCYSCRARESDDPAGGRSRRVAEAAGKWPSPAASASSRRSSNLTAGGARATAVAPSMTFGDPDASPATALQRALAVPIKPLLLVMVLSMAALFAGVAVAWPGGTINPGGAERTPVHALKGVAPSAAPSRVPATPRAAGQNATKTPRPHANK
jgi:hypothetical protein